MSYFLKKNIIKLHYKLINFLLLLFHWILFRKPSKSKAHKILIFRTGSIGDIICSLPAFHLIKKHFSGAEIHILTNSAENSNIGIKKLIDNSYFQKIIDYRNKNKRQLFKNLKKENYDLFIELTQVDSFFARLLRNMLIVRFLRIKSAFRWYYHISYVFPKFQEKHFFFPTETQRLLSVLKQNGIKTNETKYPYPISTALKQKISDLFSDFDSDKLIGIAIGGKLARNKWPLENYAKLCAHFTAKNYYVVIFGGQEDQKPAQQLATSRKIINFAGKLQPLESIEAMKTCSLVVSNDTGPLHMAYSVNTPVIGIYSSREYPGKWFPPKSKQNHAFRTQNVSCSICWRRGINLECSDNICIKQTTPEMVIAKALEILNYKNCHPAN